MARKRTEEQRIQHNEYMRKYYAKVRDKVLAKNNAYKKAHKHIWPSASKDKQREYQRRSYVRLMADPVRKARLSEQSKVWRKRHANKIGLLVIEAYGGKCACCGEANLLFLTLDHINNDGKEDRARGWGTGKNFYRRVLAQKCPKTLQLLCWNCNMGKNRNRGICPHKQALI